MPTEKDVPNTHSPSLRKLCVRYIVEHFESLTRTSSDDNEDKFVWRFTYLCRPTADHAAESILEELANRRILRQEHLTLFSRQHVDLRSVKLRNIDLSPTSISILKDFTLHEVTVENVRGINLSDVVNNLDEKTFEELQSLNVRNICFDKTTNWSFTSVLGAFHNLRCLNIGGTDFDSECLEEVVNSLPQLQYIDISETFVDDISSLRALKDNLRGLTMHDLPLKNDLSFEMVLRVLLELKELRELDVSRCNLGASSRFSEIDLFLQSSFAPHLMHLEAGGNPYCLTISDVLKFLKNHPSIQRLGLFVCDQIAKLHEDFPHVEIFGGLKAGQIINTMKYYSDRPCYLAPVFKYFSKQLYMYEIEEIETDKAIIAYVTINHLEAVVSALEKTDLSSHCFIDGMKLIALLTGAICPVEVVPRELLTRIMDLTFTVAEKSDDKDTTYWCEKCFLQIAPYLRSAFDYERYVNILFLYLDKFYQTARRFEIIIMLWTKCFPEMFGDGLDGVCENPLYMRILIKNAAEIFLEEKEAIELIAEHGEAKLGYLLDFHKYDNESGGVEIYLYYGDIFRAIRRLVYENCEARKIAHQFGVVEVMTKILQKIESMDRMDVNRKYIGQLLKIFTS